jgi:hypothetical protein
MKITGNIDIIDRYQAGFTDLELAADHFADFALQELADTLDSQGRH